MQIFRSVDMLLIALNIFWMYGLVWWYTTLSSGLCYLSKTSKPCLFILMCFRTLILIFLSRLLDFLHFIEFNVPFLDVQPIYLCILIMDWANIPKLWQKVLIEFSVFCFMFIWWNIKAVILLCLEILILLTLLFAIQIKNDKKFILNKTDFSIT